VFLPGLGGRDLALRGRLPAGGRRIAVRIQRLRKASVDVGEICRAEEAQRFLGRAEVDQPAVGQERNIGALGNIRRGMRDQHHRAPGIGQPAQRVHHLLFQPGIQARGGFVQEEQPRPGQQLLRDAHPLALAAAEPADLLGLVSRHLHFGQGVVHPLLDLVRCGIGQAHLGCIGQGIPHDQAVVDDVVLRDIAENALVGRVVGI